MSAGLRCRRRNDQLAHGGWGRQAHALHPASMADENPDDPPCQTTAEIVVFNKSNIYQSLAVHHPLLMNVN